MSPMVMRAIWEHSILPCCPSGIEVPIERFIDAHLGFVLGALAPEQARGPSERAP